VRIRWGLALVGALGAPLLTSSFLRTPGYNWVNLVGLLIATSGAVLAVMLDPTTTTGEAEAYSASAAVLRTPAAARLNPSASEADMGRAGPAAVSPAVLHAPRARSKSSRLTVA
jgi:hypothetical protein